MNRLTRIVTRTGDRGHTRIADGARVDKDSELIESIGDVDELNAVIGVLVSHLEDKAISVLLQDIQQQLFNLGADLSLPGSRLLQAGEIAVLESRIEEYNRQLPPLTEFVLPGGTRASAHAHHARTVCRRAERQLFRLARQQAVNDTGTIYLNRLSDLLFVLARILARRERSEERCWQRDDRKPGETRSSEDAQ